MRGRLGWRDHLLWVPRAPVRERRHLSREAPLAVQRRVARDERRKSAGRSGWAGALAVRFVVTIWGGFGEWIAKQRALEGAGVFAGSRRVPRLGWPDARAAVLQTGSRAPDARSGPQPSGRSDPAGGDGRRSGVAGRRLASSGPFTVRGKSLSLGGSESGPAGNRA
jgi:hypothetical protein